ncbi:MULTISPECIES: AEC family transporter [unclassified Colwellia]|uniref:AEC family transporter n=1 Tax=unclassified Colwellia TaxID=196834 RepID=UPI0015F48050|nr:MULTISPECIES: AEC family transporter [unclassified Colwellia]MBA6223997.1 AEC family transporter [Colwellia sp. MB3u-45]MBA6266540.1 AEC family transporter [Colwellia sp. MB3u-43]MBA6289466.1 AEC family transporter [Colwellia sp. MB3u-4]MBA6296727.1 AEC family transporter [Colwellia sp. MB02u-9]MBA6320178.1 AEC family transporter [Colwellia sp. MB02u-19]
MAIFTLISPLIMVGLLGFILAKSNWFNKAQVDALSKFTFNIAIPAFLFQQLANADMSTINLNIYSAFYLPLLLVYGLAWAINYYFHQHLKRDLPASAVYAFGAGYSNNVIVGMPIALMVLGEQVLPTIFLVISLHSALLIGITSVLAVNIKQFNGWIFLKQTFYNPLLIAITGGFIVNLMTIKLPVIVNNSLLLLGKPAITLALFLLGASLAFYKIRNEVKFIVTASLLKLVLLPTLILLTSHFIFQFSALTTMTLVILSASPTGVNAYLIAKQHAKHQETIAGIVVITTLMSIVSIPLWIWGLSSLFPL